MPQAHPREHESPRPSNPTIEMSSSAFADGATIPTKHTDDGANVSPPLSWGAPPPRTVSFALICEDPDAPSGLFVHWLLWGIKADERGLPEGIVATGDPDDRGQGENGFGGIGWGGPSPPPGKPHRYVFRLYALDHVPKLEPGASRRALERAMEGHVLATGKLIGRYGRGSS